MHAYDYRISLWVKHPTAHSAEISSRLGREPRFFRDVGTDLLGQDGNPLRTHAFTWVGFELVVGSNGWLMEGWPEVSAFLQAQAEVIQALNREGAEIGLRIGIFGKHAWAGFELDDVLVRLMAELRLGFQVETYFPDASPDVGDVEENS